MKKFLCLFLFAICLLGMFLPKGEFAVADSSPAFIVTANSASVFEEPDLSSQKIGSLKHKDEVYLEFDGSSPKEFLGNAFVFYKVIGSGYVLADLVVLKTQTITSIPSFNGKTNSKCTVYFKEDNDLVESEIELEKGHKIYLYEGFSRKKPYTAICFLHENQIMYGYLKTKSVSPNGVNPLIITCISLIIAVLGIIFAWLFMKNKKIKKQAKKVS